MSKYVPRWTYYSPPYRYRDEQWTARVPVNGDLTQLQWKDKLNLSRLYQPNEVIEKVAEFGANHIECTVEIEEEYDNHQAWLLGWREATLAEQEQVTAFLAEQVLQAKEREERQLEHARKLLKERGEL